jgi:hypothetical protein
MARTAGSDLRGSTSVVLGYLARTGNARAAVQ